VVLQLLAANHIRVVTLPPHLMHTTQPVDVGWARAFKIACGRWLRKRLQLGALERACAQRPPAGSRR
jgi:hypothetical protein